jgi:3-hydroxy-3-methylglutaryl CoA synthase
MTTPGIESYGAYVPPTRLPLGAIGGGKSKEGGPERAVAWNDEDAVTMAATAAVNCLRGFDRASVDGVLFASTTYPFREKQGAAFLAKALDLRRDVRTADVSGSLRAGFDALQAAADAIAAGSARRILVVASDCRLGAPGSGLERTGGDGAVAFLVGAAGAIATFAGWSAVADEIVDVWRSEGDRFVHAWEERFVVSEGYTPRLVEAVKGLLTKVGAQAGDFAHVALYGPDDRSHAGAVKALRLDPARIVPPLFGQLGNAGCAFAPLLLASALERAKAGERILAAAYGDGALACALAVTDRIEKLEPRRGVAWNLARRRPVKSYDRYLKARSLETGEWAAAADPGLSATIHFRERDEDVSFVGQRCTKCRAVQFPNQRICETCFAKDAFEPIRLSDRLGKVVTYTFDFFFPTPDPPTIVTVTEVEGARIHLQLVNVAPEHVKLGLPIELELRRIHQVGGRPNYYWKGTPVPDEVAS